MKFYKTNLSVQGIQDLYSQIENIIFVKASSKIMRTCSFVCQRRNTNNRNRTGYDVKT